MKNQIKTNTRSFKKALIAVATASVVGLSAMPAQAFTSAPNPATAAAQTNSVIELAGFRSHRGHRRGHSFKRHSGHRSHYGAKKFHSKRYGSFNRGSSSHRFARKNNHRGHGYNHGVKINLFGLR